MELATRKLEDSSRIQLSSTTTSSSASSSINNNGNGSSLQHHQHQHIITRSDHYPTTFVQADTSSFKQVVQMLTGGSPRSPDSSPRPPVPSPSSAPKGNFVIPPIKTTQPKKHHHHHSGNKLYERRSSSHNNFKNSLMINTLMIGGNGSARSPRFSPRNQEILSPSCLDFPKLALNSPVTPLKHGNDGDPFDRMSPLSEEERAIAEKGFYLHQSPISTPRESEPQLLPLFPVTSPRVVSSEEK